MNININVNKYKKILLVSKLKKTFLIKRSLLKN